MFAERDQVVEAIAADQLVLQEPATADGPRMWQLAKDAGALDVNSPYSYLLWARDFRNTSIVARHGGRLGGFVTGYLRPDSPTTLFVWQVAVAAELRGHGLGRRMLDGLCDRRGRLGFDHIEATVTPSNTASTRLFESLAGGYGVRLGKEPLFDAEVFPGTGHEPEILFTIGPFPDI